MTAAEERTSAGKSSPHIVVGRYTRSTLDIAHTNTGKASIAKNYSRLARCTARGTWSSDVDPSLATDEWTIRCKYTNRGRKPSRRKLSRPKRALVMNSTAARKEYRTNSTRTRSRYPATAAYNPPGSSYIVS